MNQISSFALSLREETKPLHDSAERHQFQTLLAKGQLSKEAIADFLNQMRHVHTALEAALRDLREKRPEVAPLIDDRHFQRARIETDLESLGVSLSQEGPTPGCAAFAKRIAWAVENEPIRLLGFHYVLEGSNNGARFFVKCVRRALGCAEGEGLAFFDPHGDEQPAMWHAFRTAMGDVTAKLSERERTQFLEGAKEMYRAHTAISDDLSHHLSPTA